MGGAGSDMQHEFVARSMPTTATTTTTTTIIIITTTTATTTTTTPTTSTTAASKWYAACSVPYAIGRGHTVCVIGCAA